MKQKIRDPKKYRTNVGIMLLNKAGHVFVAKRIGLPDDASWQMPQGGVNDGEDLLSAAKRELQEEIGVTSIELLQEAPDWFFYDFPPQIQKNVWGGQYLGQKQKWFLMRFTGVDSEIDLLGSSDVEFQEWQWVKPHYLPDLVIDFKHHVYEEVLHTFRDYLKV